MEDERIIDLYWQRSQEAISRTDEKYGRLCTKISLNILSNAQDAEECVSDTYMALWNSIPPQRPTCFQAFAAAIVRNLSLMKLREQYARKRGGGEFDLVLDELKDTIASCDSVEAECERKEFATEHKSTVNYLAVENHLFSRHVGTVDVAEDAQVLRASTKRKGDCERVAVRAAKKAVVGDIFKRSVLLESSEFAVDKNLHYLRVLGDLLRKSLS